MAQFQEMMRQQLESSMHSELEKLLDTATGPEREVSRKDFEGFNNLFHRFLQIQPYDKIAARGLPNNVAESLNKLVVVKLNGGLGTSMGCKGPKSLISVRNENTFLDLTVQQIEHLNKTYNTDVPLVLMNSFNTDEDTKKILQKYTHHRVKIHTFNQSRYPRINKESLLPVATDLSMNGPNAEAWYPPGHGDIYASFYNSGVLDKLIAQGREYIFVSNIDNLGATVDLHILHQLVSQPNGKRCELHHGGDGQDARRREGRGGGDGARARECRVEGLKRRLGSSGRNADPVRREAAAAGDRPGPQGPRGRVQVRLQVQDLQHQQLVDLPGRHQEAAGAERDGHGDHRQPQDSGRRPERHPAGDGGGSSHQVLRQRPGHQRAPQPLPARQDHVGPAAGHVQPVQPGRRLAHHEPQEGVPHHAARQTGKLLHQGDLLLLLHRPKFRSKCPPLANAATLTSVQVQEYLTRFESIPDMLELDHLTVSGDVTLGKNVSLKGTVIIIANHGDRIDIPAGSMLENKIVSGNLRIMDH
ncbi:unnamed protein product [Tetraodon nigroviridis]|uniref:UTP--glucose-1-phosphate uridylyltransferase n=1 Tax=Tetraodon nigroviridis TaxID=99883 RepID=Q4SGC8_TETNG|nr:unnamed protein product [Tetraodon nigroviridis]